MDRQTIYEEFKTNPIPDAPCGITLKENKKYKL